MIPNDIRYLHERAKSYQMIEFHKEAIEDFENVIRRNPNNANAYFRRAFSHKNLGVSFPYCIYKSTQNFT